MTEPTAVSRWKQEQPIENRGMLKATGWKSLVGNIPENSGGDSYAAVITKTINFIINNQKYDQSNVYVGILFIKWDGTAELVGYSWTGEDVRIELMDQPILDDIYYKDIEHPELHNLGH